MARGKDGGWAKFWGWISNGKIQSDRGGVNSADQGVGETSKRGYEAPIKGPGSTVNKARSVRIVD